MKTITIEKMNLKKAVAAAMLFFSCVNLSAQAPVITTNTAGGKDYTFSVAAPGNLKVALVALKTGFSFTAGQKDNFIITGELNADDISYFGKGSTWSANSWNLNELNMSDATTALMEGQFDGVKTSNIKKVILPKNLATVPNATFAGCTATVYGAAVKSIGVNCYSWARWSTLGTFDAKTQYPVLETLQNNAFAFNDSGADFTGIILPETFTTFGTDVFSQCPKLASITIYATTPPALGSFGNRDEQKWNGTGYVTVPAVGITLYVPEEAIAAYKAVPAYITYFGVDNIKKLSEFPTTVKTTGEEVLKVVASNGKIQVLDAKSPVFVQVFSLSGSLVSSELINTESTFTLNKGCYIVKVGTQTTKVIM